MDKLIDFDQTTFLSDVMDIDGWESALHDGSCTVLSAYFIKLALDGANIDQIGVALAASKANIAELQQAGFERHYRGHDGYGHVLQTIGLAWSGPVYSDPNGHYHPGECALCLFDLPNNTSHTLAILFHVADDLIYTFDPNSGLFASNPQAWYQSDFLQYLQNEYGAIQNLQFNNVTPQQDAG